METKKAIRKEIFRRRKEASLTSVRENSEQIWQKLFSLPAFQESDWIYLYIDCKNEVMTDGIIEEAFRLGKKVAAPKVIGEDMIFYQISQPEDLEPGYFGIREPKTDLPVADGEDGLMVMPGVAFDDQRHRVGYGGGFYDRYLSKHTRHFTAALAFEFQMMEEVPTEPTDLLPDVVITEKNIYR